MQITTLIEILETIDRGLLPDSLVELLEVLGGEDTIHLVREYPGIPLYVPLTYNKQGDIAQAIGVTAYGKLWEVFQSTVVHMPKLDILIKQAKYAQIEALRNQGVKISDIAIRVGYTARHVGRVLAKLDQPVVARPQVDANQRSLF